MDQGREIGEKEFLNITPPGKAPDEELDNCIGKPLKEDPCFPTRKLAKVPNIPSTIVRNNLTQSLGMKCHHIRWVPHMLT
jgi:hypothetical protein